MVIPIKLKSLKREIKCVIEVFVFLLTNGDPMLTHNPMVEHDNKACRRKFIGEQEEGEQTG